MPWQGASSLTGMADQLIQLRSFRFLLLVWVLEAYLGQIAAYEYWDHYFESSLGSLFDALKRLALFLTVCPSVDAPPCLTIVSTIAWKPLKSPLRNTAVPSIIAEYLRASISSPASAGSAEAARRRTIVASSSEPVTSFLNRLLCEIRY